MAGEFQHKAVGEQLTQPEYEGAARHELNGQAQGDVLYVNATPDIVRLPAGLVGEVLGSGGPSANPLWVSNGRVNLLTNPGFEIWQRGTTFADLAAYTADRWYGSAYDGSAPASGGLTISQEYELHQDDYSEFSCKVVHDGTVTPEAHLLSQEIESPGTLTLSTLAQGGGLGDTALTFMAGVKVATANIVRLVIESESGGTWTEEAGFTVAEITSTFKRFSVTWSPTVAGKTGVRVGFKFLSGVTETVYLDNCSAAVGAGAIAYQPLPQADEWARCLRYYEILGDKAGTSIAFGGYTDAARNLLYTMSFFPKAVVPTLTKEGTWSIINCGQPIVSTPTKSQLTIYAVSSGAGWTQFTADSVGERITIEANP